MTGPETGGPESRANQGAGTDAEGGLTARVAALFGSRLRQANRRLLPGRLLHGPEWLVLGVNNVCNLHCRMCDVGQAETETNFARNLLGSSPRDMPMELMAKIVGQSKRYFPKTRLGFAFTEPLIYPHLVESVALATENGLATAVTSNGLTLKRTASELARAGLGEFYLSLDGPGSIHDEIRGRAGAFDRALDGVEALQAEETKPKVSIFCVITAWNQSHLVAFLDRLSGLHINQIGFMHPNFTTEEVVRTHNALYGGSYPATTSNLGPFDPLEVDLESLRAEIEEIRLRRWPFPVSFSPDLQSHEDLDRFYRRPGEFVGSSCGDAFRTLMIKSDGRVIPAHGRCYDLTIGNLHESTLPEIWNSPEIIRFRRTLNRAGGLLPACARCCSAF